MTMNIGRYKIAMNASQDDLASTSAALIITPASPIQVVRFGLLVTVVANGGTLVINGNHEEADGTAVSPSGAAAIGTMTLTTNPLTVNSGWYQEVSSPYLILPGERAEFIVGTGATDGDGFIWAEYIELPFQPQPTNRLSTDPGYTTPGLANWLSTYTEVTS